MTISVVIPAYNEEHFVGDCIESVLRYAPAQLVQIVVVCNACTDNTAAVAAKYPRVTVLEEPRKGTGFARQKGFESAHGDIIAYLDADSRVHERWFPMILQAFTARPSLVSLSGPCRFYDLIGWKNSLVTTWWKIAAFLVRSHKRFVVVGGNLAVRRSALQQIGGFDTSIPFWGDDTNLAQRLHEVGDLKFTLDFYTLSSARRLKANGFVRTGWNYALNYFSQTYFHTTFTKSYGERPWEQEA